jgi:hypothetical protein
MPRLTKAAGSADGQHELLRWDGPPRFHDCLAQRSRGSWQKRRNDPDHQTDRAVRQADSLMQRSRYTPPSAIPKGEIMPRPTETDRRDLTLYRVLDVVQQARCVACRIEDLAVPLTNGAGLGDMNRHRLRNAAVSIEYLHRDLVAAGVVRSFREDAAARRAREQAIADARLRFDEAGSLLMAVEDHLRDEDSETGRIAQVRRLEAAAFALNCADGLLNPPDRSASAAMQATG